MTRAAMINASKQEISLIINILGNNRNKFAEVCRLSSTRSIGWWIKTEQLPIFRLQYIKDALDAEFSNLKALSKEQQQAMILISDLLKRGMVDQAIEKNTNPQEVFMTKLKPTHDALQMLKAAVRDQLESPSSASLSHLELNDLVKEIEARGWKATLTLAQK